MSNGYKSIRVKKEVWEALHKAAELLNSVSTDTNKVTIAGLVTRLAIAYESQMDVRTILGSNAYWALQGMPMIVDSDTVKHYVELKGYYPNACTNIVNEYVREKAMTKRFESIGVGNA